MAHYAEAPLPLRETLKIAGALRADPYAGFESMLDQHGDYVRFQVGPKVATFVNKPDSMFYLLTHTNSLTSKDTPDIAMLRGLTGTNIFTVGSNPGWEHYHDLSKPGFHRSMMHGYMKIIDQETDHMLDSWAAQADVHPDTYIPDLQREFMYLTVKIASRALLDYPLSDSETADLNWALTNVLEFYSDCVNSVGLAYLVRGLPTPRNHHARQAMDIIRGYTHNVVSHRIAKGGDHADDLLNHMLSPQEAYDELSPAEVESNILAMMIAGHETTANALTWAFYDLANPQNTQHRDTMRSHPTSADGSIRHSYASLSFQETLRLHPPLWLIARRAEEDIILPDGFSIPRRSLIGLSPYMVHRRTESWPEPDVFDPTRFTRAIEQGSYIPFGMGQRICIGKPLAMMEGPRILDKVNQRVNIYIPRRDEIRPALAATLRPDRNVEAQIQLVA